MNAKAGGNTWESVTAFISFDLKKEGKKVGKRSNEPQRVSTLLNDTKPGKHTDKARMRQVCHSDLVFTFYFSQLSSVSDPFEAEA